jgi:Bacterial Ig domain
MSKRAVSKPSRKKLTNKISVKKNATSLSWKRMLLLAIPFAAIGAYLIFQSQAAVLIPSSSVQVNAGEGSGMVASKKHPGVFWWHRDGGTATADKPRDAIYAMKLDASGKIQPVRGTETFPFYLVSGSKNNNWEDVALDDQNNIWIGDIGANDCSRNNQKFLKVSEPDPTTNTTLTISASYTFKFPDPAAGCNTWNSEAMFWLDGKMYIFAKTSNSPVYRVDFPSSSSGTATLTRLGILAGGVSNISVSSISSDRSRLMVASHGITNIYTTQNTSLTGDALVKDLISRKPVYSANFDCRCSTKAAVEGGSFRHNSRDVAFVSENKYIYYATAAFYGDTSAPSSPVQPVGDTAAPSVNITSPINGATIGGTITIEVTASDNVGLKQVKLLYDDSGVIRDGSSQGTYGWGSRFNTSVLSNGTHTISAVASDAAGNKTTSKISVQVKN